MIKETISRARGNRKKMERGHANRHAIVEHDDMDATENDHTPQPNAVGAEIEESIVDSQFQLQPEPAQKGLHTMETLAALLPTMQEQCERAGYRNISIDTVTPPVRSYEGALYAAPIRGTELSSNRPIRGWIYLQITKDGVAEYRLSWTNEVVDRASVPPESALSAALQAMSEQAKVVKSRPTWMYPELFHLEPEEVWPKDAHVAVIGDPYQACDREGVTIVEYEYADEMLPPVLSALLEKKEYDFVQGWLEGLYFEDVRSLERIYGMHTPYEVNPYASLVHKSFQYAQTIGEAIANQETDYDRFQPVFEELQSVAKKFINGSWTLEDGSWTCDRTLTGDLSDASEKALRDWYDYKEEVMKKKGDPREWQDFTNRWNSYLDSLPTDFLRERDERTDKKIAQAHYWLQELPRATSPERITTGTNFLEQLYWDFRTYYSKNEPESMSLDNADVAQATDREWGAFGYFMPGFPVSLRTKKIIEEALLRCEQLLKYGKGLLPELVKERKRITELGVTLDADTMYSYLRTFEQAYARQHFFLKRTQRAIPIHGFFPYEMPGIDPQDRIVALTSVTMHGWNHLHQEDFKKDIQAALPYLRVEGKYILGPINQEIYFGGYSEEFDAEGLTKALQELEDEGLITYTLKKGQREHFQNGSDWYEASREDNWDSNEKILHPNESAHSLVITRVR